MSWKFFPLIWITIISLTGLAFCSLQPSSTALAETITASNTLEIVAQIKQADVVYLGEKHDSPSIHQQQLAIIKQLQQDLDPAKSGLVIAWEMFQRPFQPMLDRYLAGTINESQLRQQTEYDTRWGFDWEFYAPILRWAKKQQIPLIALNTPEEITQKVATSGLNSLEKHDWRYIPPLAEIKLDNPEYRQKLAEIYQQHVATGQGNSTDADNFFAAQVLWDETMAEAIARQYQQQPHNQIIVLVGQAHVMYDYAIPDRVTRRIDSAEFSQSTLLLNDQ